MEEIFKWFVEDDGLVECGVGFFLVSVDGD